MPKFKFDDVKDDIQGDILLGGLPKRTQTFLFFSIDPPNRVQEFQAKLRNDFVPLITTAKQVQEDRENIKKKKETAKKNNTTAPIQPISGLNISFTQKGLDQLQFRRDSDDEGKKIGEGPNPGEEGPFNKGMLNGAKDLGDPGTTRDKIFIPNWDKNWLPGAIVKDTTVKVIHGLIMVTGDDQGRVDERLTKIRDIFSGLISEVHKLEGNVRPGDQKGHEHFGFLDGVSQPAVEGVDDPEKVNPGQQLVPPKVILLVQEDDTKDGKNKGPSWALNGSFLAFRHLSQLVPEFNKFLEDHAIPGLPPKDGAELLGARLMGRWKSGAPIAVTPFVDDPAMGADPNRNDDFKFDQKSQVGCPYAAHIRKTHPRNDIAQGRTTSSRIIRSGIPYGPEVSGKEALNRKTEKTNDRGLFFVSYQSDLSKGFTFIQQSWANNETFPTNKDVKIPGFDPIIGQKPHEESSATGQKTQAASSTTGQKPQEASSTTGQKPQEASSAAGQKSEKASNEFHITGADFKELTPLLLNQWVIPKGGEYFFVPTVSAIKKYLAASPPAK